MTEETETKPAGVDQAESPPEVPRWLTVCDIEIPEAGFHLKGYLEQIEITLIDQALERCQGNKAATARMLGCLRTTLLEKMRRYGFALRAPTRRRPPAEAPTGQEELAA